MIQIVGFNLKKINAEKVTEIKTKDKLEIKSNFSFSDVKEEDIDISKDKRILGFSFTFDVNYEPKIASIRFEGLVLLMMDEKEAKDILKEWKKKKVREDIRILLYNQILLRCSVKALQIEEEFSIPFHIPMPRFTPESQKQPGQNYAG